MPMETNDMRDRAVAGRDWRSGTLDGLSSGHICCDDGDGTCLAIGAKILLQFINQRMRI